MAATREAETSDAGSASVARSLTPQHAVGLVRRHTLAIAGMLALLAYYLWTVSSSGYPFAFAAGSGGSYFNLLADAFLHGKLHLLVEPAPRLLHLADPYDPAANALYRLHDASLYHGHYYLEWGPVPALLLYIPFRALGVGDLTDTLAVAVLAFIGTCFAVALLRFLVRRFLPSTPRWMTALGVIALPFATALPFMLRRIAVYEVSIASGYCFASAGFYLLATGVLRGPPRARRLFLASLCFGLAVGSRQTWAVAALLLYAVVGWLVVRGRSGSRALPWRLAGVVVAPVTICLALLAAYDYARFGSIFEFGQHYQLASVNMRDRKLGSLLYVVPGVWYYLFARAHIGASFPFFHLPPPPQSYPGNLPANYDGVEATGGLIANVPVVLLAFVPWLGIRRHVDRTLWLVVVTMTVLGSALVVLVSYSLWGATERYEVDFATLFFVAGLLVWFGIVGNLVTRWRLVVQLAGAVAVLWGTAFGASIAMAGYSDSMLADQRGTWAFLERATAPVSYVIAHVEGRPAVVRIAPISHLAAPATLTTGPSVHVSSSDSVLETVAPSAGRYRLSAVPTGGVWQPVSANLCANPGFEKSTEGWVGLTADDGLRVVRSDHFARRRVLEVSIPNADQQGVVYSSARRSGIASDTVLTAAVWVKGTASAALEMQIRVVNTDGSSEGAIEDFIADGGWQHEAATTFVPGGKTGANLQILVIRRGAAGRDRFYVADARASIMNSRTPIRLSFPGHRENRIVPLGAFSRGIDVRLHDGFNRLVVRSSLPGIDLNYIALTRAGG